MTDLKDKIDVLERKILEERVSELEEKLEKITKARIKPVANVEKDMKNLDRFYEKHIIVKKGNKLKTVEVLNKINEFVEPFNIKFSKFEVAKFILGKEVVRKKIGSHNFYMDIDIV